MDRYDVLVQKLAGEIVESAVMEKEASGLDTLAGAGIGALIMKKKAKKAAGVAAEVAKKRLIAGTAGAGALGLGAGVMAGRASKEAAEYNEEMERLAAEENEAQIYAILEKAAAVYEEAQFLKQAAEEAAEEAAIYEDAATQIFEELGLLNDEADGDYEDGEYVESYEE